MNEILGKLAGGDLRSIGRSEERKGAASMLESSLGEKSRIVRTFALQALADLAVGDRDLAVHVISILEEQAGCGIPSVQSRSKKLLAKLRKMI